MEQNQSALFSLIGHKGDLMLLHFRNNFDELKSLGREKVAGKIVLFNEIYDKKKAAAGLSFVAYGEAVRYRGMGPRAAAELGAVAATHLIDADGRDE